MGEILIVITTGFLETAVVTTLCNLRQAGLPVKLMGQQSGLVTSACGLTVQPDRSLLDWETAVNGTPLGRAALVIPGNSVCAAALLSDPRLHQLMEAILQQEGVVAVMRAAQPLLAEVWGETVYTLPNVLLQEEGETAVFVQRLLKRLC